MIIINIKRDLINLCRHLGPVLQVFKHWKEWRLEVLYEVYNVCEAVVMLPDNILKHLRLLIRGVGTYSYPYFFPQAY